MAGFGAFLHFTQKLLSVRGYVLAIVYILFVFPHSMTVKSPHTLAFVTQFQFDCPVKPYASVFDSTTGVSCLSMKNVM